MSSKDINFSHTMQLAAVVLLIALSGCTDYWWSRGQAPSPKVLVERSQAKLDESFASYGSSRQELVPIFKDIEHSLITAVSAADQQKTTEVASSLSVVRDKLLALEGKLSVTSRAPYGELAGQLRVFLHTANQNQRVELDALSLYTARTFFFMSSELSVPAPSFG